MLGKDLLICDSSGNSLIAAARTCEIVTNAERIETASPVNGTARTFESGRTDWSIIVGSLTESPTADLLQVGGLPVIVQVKIRGGAAVQGSAFFTTCRITGSMGSLVKGTFVLQGTGPLASVTQN